MKPVVYTLTILGAFVLNSWSDVQLQVLNYAQREVRLIYEFKDDMAGNKEFRFPGSGFIHDPSLGPIIVESVFDKSNNMELEYSVLYLPESNAPQIRINYPSPLREGEAKNLLVTVIVHLPQENMGRDSLGRYFFKYETSHQFFFRIPQDMYVINTNQPVLVYEREGWVYLEQTDLKKTQIEISLRAK